MMVYRTFTLNSEYQWEPIGADDFENVVVSIEGTWTGNVEFWGTNDYPDFDGSGDFNWTKWALNDSVAAATTTVTTVVAGTSPTEVGKSFRGSIAGLRAFAVYADAGFSGTARVVVSVHRAAK